MEYSIKALAAQIDANVVGDGGVNVTGVASVTDAGGGDVVFAEDEENLAAALKSRAAAVIAGEFAQGAKTPKAILIVSHPRLAFARAARLLGDHAGQQSGIHPSAVIHPSAKLGEQVVVGANAVIGQVNISDRTRIGAGCVIGDGVEIGEDCEIYSNVTIYPDSRLGNRVIVHAGAVLGSDGFGYVRDPKTGHHEKFPQVGRLEIEDDVEIGANTTIDRGALEMTRIGRGTKIDNLVHIGHNCQFGEDVIIAAQAGFSGSIIIENQVVIGGQVGVGEHARIQEGVLLGGQAGVLPKKILRGKGVAFWGTPAKPLRGYLRSLASLARLGKKEQ
jgi:UDP-3-O-[3-hydroxymyristoyl] glucosamine N-acyltransferase